MGFLCFSYIKNKTCFFFKNMKMGFGLKKSRWVVFFKKPGFFSTVVSRNFKFTSGSTVFQHCLLAIRVAELKVKCLTLTPTFSTFLTILNIPTPDLFFRLFFGHRPKCFWNDWKNLVILVIMSENIGYWTLLWRVLMQLWDKWPKCFSDQHVSAKKWPKCHSEKKSSRLRLKRNMSEVWLSTIL